MNSRYGQLIRLRPEYEERYIILHRHVFPGVLEQIRKSHIHNYSIYLDAGILFAYFEHRGSDFVSDMEAMAVDPITRDWWKLTDPMQDPMPDRRPGDWWTRLEEIFHSSSGTAPSANRRGFVADLDPQRRQAATDELRQIRDHGSELISRSHIQSCSVFLHESRLYFYLEYPGGQPEPDFAGRADGLFQSLVSRSLAPGPSEDGRLLRPVAEVFHID